MHCTRGMLALSAAVLAGACATQAPSARNGSAELAPSGALSEGQQLQVLSTLDALEIEQGHAAVTKAHTPAVRAFAAASVEAHGKAREERAQWATLRDSPLTESALSRALSTRGRTTLQALLGADADSFDRLYIATQLAQQQNTLQLLDAQLLPAAQGRARSPVLEAGELARRQLSLAQQVNAALPR